MSSDSNRKKRLDSSLGNALFPMKHVAQFAFRRVSKNLRDYTYMTLGNGDETISPVLYTISDHFTARKLHDEGYSGLGCTELLVTGNGVSGAFDLIMQSLAAGVRKEMAATKRTIKPAILMPVPTYGFFVSIAELQGIDVIPVPRDLKNGGALSYDTLLQVIRA